MLLPIQDASEVIQYAQVILDFTIFAQYVLYDEETLRYMKHALYKLKKTKILFKQHRPINFKLCQSIFNYPEFHAINHFI